jgi:hypothetical protein
MELYSVILYAHIVCAMGMAAAVAMLMLSFLMTTKPGLGVTLAVIVAALTLGALSGALLRQKSREATEAT